MMYTHMHLCILRMYVCKRVCMCVRARNGRGRSFWLNNRLLRPSPPSTRGVKTNLKAMQMASTVC